MGIVRSGDAGPFLCDCPASTRPRAVFLVSVSAPDAACVSPGGASAASERPDEAARYYGQLLGAPAQRAEDGGYIVRAGTVDLRVLSPETLAHEVPGLSLSGTSLPCVVGFTVSVSRLAETETYLNAAGVVFVRSTTDTLCILPENAHGLLVTFTEERGI